MKFLQCLTAILMGFGCLSGSSSKAESPRTAVFPFEFVDTSLQGSIEGRAASDTARLNHLNVQLQEILSKSGKYAPIADPGDPSGPDLHTCGQCAVDIGKKLSAHFSVVGWVQKVSNLILNINIAIYDVTSGVRVAGGSVDIRGDTDESWTRGLSYLMRNRILDDAG